MQATSMGPVVTSDLELCVVVRLPGRPYSFLPICISPLHDQRQPGLALSRTQSFKVAALQDAVADALNPAEYPGQFRT